MQLSPRTLHGAWDGGRVLDRHVSSSEFIGYNEQGHPQFESTRTELGELLFRLKYRSDRSAIVPIAQAASDFIRSWNPELDVIVPASPSKSRAVQPLFQSGATLTALARLLKESGGASAVFVLALTRTRS
jgi:competence protein ComFC